MQFYVAVTAAVVTAIEWTLAVSFNAERIEQVVTDLVIACLHALSGRRDQHVVRRTQWDAHQKPYRYEQVRGLGAIIFHKTGTLTKREQVVVADPSSVLF